MCVKFQSVVIINMAEQDNAAEVSAAELNIVKAALAKEQEMNARAHQMIGMLAENQN